MEEEDRQEMEPEEATETKKRQFHLLLCTSCQCCC